MAYHDTLFQLGMDLTRSSTAQKEDHGVSARVAQRANASRASPVHRTHEDSITGRVDRSSEDIAGQHLLIDLFDASRLGDVGHVDRTLHRCVEVAGAKLLHVHLHQSAPNGGIAGVAVLADSHISFHSWPVTGYAAFDVFMRAEAEPEQIVEILRHAFSAGRVTVKTEKRGENVGEIRWQGAVTKKAAPRIRKAKAA